MTIKMQHDKRVEQLRKLELKQADYMRTEKTKKEIEKLESQMVVASQAIETTSIEIIKLRDTELYPQLLELVKGLVYVTCMTRRPKRSLIYLFFLFLIYIVGKECFKNWLGNAEKFGV